MGEKIKTPVVLIRDKFYVRTRHVDEEKAEQLYRTILYKESGCKSCEYKPDRPVEQCYGGCENFVGDFRLHKRTEIEGKAYYSFPVGNVNKLKKLLGKKIKFKDERVEGKSIAKYGIKIKVKNLYKYQIKAINKWLDEGGVLQSAPRTGKSVMTGATVIKRGRNTLILVHQEDLAKQFLETFRDPLFFNIKEREKDLGRKLVAICRELEDFKKYPICIATYQTFLSAGGKKKLKKIVKMFGTVAVDEVHRANAAGYAKTLNQFWAAFRIACSATPKRKDGLHFIVRDIVGPIVYKTKAKPMVPVLDVVETGLRTQKNYQNWTYAMRFLERDKERNQLLVKHAVREVKKGHSLVIPVTFTNHADTLVRMINGKAGKKIATVFTGKQTKDQRRKIILQARSGKWKVVVAMRQLLTGVNVPPWSMIFEQAPINNAPNLEQEVLRVCTPAPDKLQPTIRFFVDDFGPSRSCFISSMAHLRQIALETFDLEKGFEMSEAGREVSTKYHNVHYKKLSQRAARWRDPDDQYKPERRKFGGSKGKHTTYRKREAPRFKSGVKF